MRKDAGFSLVELLIAMTVMLLISGAAVTALLKLSTTQSTIWNRTQMHSGIRGATEVLQQEVGQAGRITLASVSATCTVNGYVPCITTAVSSGSAPATSVTTVCGMFIGQQLLIDQGQTTQEVVTISKINGAASDPTSVTCPSGSTISAGNFTPASNYGQAHGVAAPVQAVGGFSAGIVPSSTTNGSTSAVLKLFGDVNADGNMVYVEYSVSPACICTNTCSPTSTTGNLYRNSMAWNASSKTSATASQILLGNVTANPGGAACFSYTTNSANGNTYVTDVGVTLTVQTQLLDPLTKTYQTETKALLNVSPRNVFNTWQLDSAGYAEKVQPTPATVTNLLAGAS